jgi:cyclopropane fatty-acyl-phospholipid synthase-like methyltransferase
MGNIDLLKNDELAVEFYQMLLKTNRRFSNHFFSSVPFVLEEWCRLGATFIRYLTKYKKMGTLYTLGSGDGILARTTGKLGNGKITTFSCSPTKANKDVFYSDCTLNSHFCLAPYFDITNDTVQEYISNYDGFDIIIEDTTFQMYSNDRNEQISFIKRKLKSDGIMIFLEKMKADNDEYILRESEKDILFKSRYFSNNEIEKKNLKY